MPVSINTNKVSELLLLQIHRILEVPSAGP